MWSKYQLKQKFVHKYTNLFLLLCSCIPLSNGIAADSVSNLSVHTIPTTQLQQSYTWYDGEIQREVWLNPRLIVEFNSNRGQKNQQRAMAINVKVKPVSSNINSVRFWYTDSQTRASAVISSVREDIKSNPVSAVLHDNASSDSAMRALPGNIILYLNPDWDQATSERWLKQKGLLVVSQRQLQTNVFIVKSNPGLESLLKANELYETGEVIAAFPNWWKALVGK